MNRDVERAAAKLEKVCREADECWDPAGNDDEFSCDTGRMADAAEELLEELRRAGVIPAAP
jgi:hypothetical protein